MVYCLDGERDLRLNLWRFLSSILIQLSTGRLREFPTHCDMLRETLYECSCSYQRRRRRTFFFFFLRRLGIMFKRGSYREYHQYEHALPCAEMPEYRCH